MPENAVKHLYFFDDLSYHLRRICGEDGIPSERADEIVRKVWAHLTDALSCLEHGSQDFNLVNWEHACTQLAWELNDRELSFDMIVSQGCNGEYALDSLLTLHEQEYGAPFARARANVRVAHFLRDPNNAFYSDFEIGVSKGPSLSEQCEDVARQLTKLGPTGDRFRLAVFDDCIQTGEGTSAVVEAILAKMPAHVETTTLAFVGCQATQNRFRERGWRPIQGVLLRGETYPRAWDHDIYFLKDLFLNNAIRFTDGSSVAYVDGGWFDKIFAGNPEKAAQAITRVKETLEEYGLYKKLEAM